MMLSQIKGQTRWEELWTIWRIGDTPALRSFQPDSPVEKFIHKSLLQNFNREEGYELAIEQIRHSNDVWRGRFLYALAWYYHAQDNFALAMASLQAGAVYASNSGDATTERHIWQFRATIEHHLGIYDEAWRCVQRAESVCLKLEFAAEEMYAAAIYSAVALTEHQGDRGMAAAQRAHDLAQQVPDDFFTLWPQIALGAQLEHRGRAHEAESLYQNLLTHAKVVGYDEWRTSLCLMIGRAQLRQKKDDGEAYLREGIRSAADRNHVVYLRLGQKLLYEYLLTVGRFDEAAHQLELLDELAPLFDAKRVLPVAQKTEKFFFEAVAK